MTTTTTATAKILEALASGGKTFDEIIEQTKLDRFEALEVLYTLGDAIAVVSVGWVGDYRNVWVLS